jgi:XTP/dITP diphosphohydrolase
MDLIFATNNAHKAEEVRRILAPHRLSTLAEIGFTDDPPETGSTFAANALQKARFVYEATGRAAVADDSGIEVDDLGGAPGVHSKRYSPSATTEANNALLLEQLGDSNERRARFRCAVAWVGPQGEQVVEGACEGTIATEPSGGGGFGYDPLFLPAEAPGRSMAELSPTEKDAISHRGRAFRAFAALLTAP